MYFMLTDKWLILYRKMKLYEEGDKTEKSNLVDARNQ